jgi:glyoxylase-like metal-dependent hydrolase (beta-lactamase superfamily II)
MAIRRLIGAALCACAVQVLAPSLSHALEAVQAPRLYAIDCGRMTFKDMAAFSDTGEYDGKSGAIAVPCFLIRHPKGMLLWDAGLGDQLAGAPPPAGEPSLRMIVTVTLAQQLQQIGVRPADVTYIAFSHLHGDHTGNANTFAASKWIMNKRELEWALTSTFAVQPATFSAYKSAKVQMIDGDHDVFGDGAVRILKTPGHTPGHQALLVKLAKSGTVLLSGDLYHLRDDRKNRYVPLFNDDRAQTLASYDRFERIAQNTHARVIIQHDPQDFASLPKFPAYLD